MIGEDFKFGSSWLSDFSMRMYDSEDTPSFVTRNIEKGDITAQRAKPNHFTTTYSDALILNFFILKDDDVCETQEDFKLTGDEINYLRSWLESPRKPTELICLTEEDEFNVHYYGVFTSVQPYMIAGDCYGLNLEFTCNSPYGYSDEYLTTYTMQSGVTEYVKYYNNESAEKNEYVKPVLIINADGTFIGEQLTITNMSDDSNAMVLTLPSGLSKLVIDCEKKTIKDGSGNLLPLSAVGVTTPSSSDYNFISTESYLFYWLSLVPDMNKLKFNLASSNKVKTIQISARYIIKSGGF